MKKTLLVFTVLLMLIFPGMAPHSAMMDVYGQGNVREVPVSRLDTVLQPARSADSVLPDVSTVNEKQDFWIAPNPSLEFINIYGNSDRPENLTVHVYTILGRRLYTFHPELQSSGQLLHEDTSRWLPGTYLVRIEADGTVLKTMRFVKR